MSVFTFPQARVLLARAAYHSYNRNQLAELLQHAGRAVGPEHSHWALAMKLAWWLLP